MNSGNKTGEERHQATFGLDQSEQNLELLDLFNNAHDIIQSLDMEGRFLYVNARWHEVLGYSEAELSSLNVFDIIRADQQQKCREILASLPELETLTNVKTVFVAKGGQDVMVEGNIALRSDAGRPVATRGIFRDISEQAAILKQLQEQLTRSQMILSHAPLGIMLYDALGGCVEANAEAGAIIGGSVEELLKQNFRRIRAWQKSGMLAKAEAALVGRCTTYHESWVTTSFGKRVCLKCCFVHLVLNERAHLLAMLEDVTAQRDGELARLSYQNRLSYVHHLALDIAQCNKLDDVLQKTVDVAVGMVAADFGALVYLDPKTGKPSSLFSSRYPVETIPPEEKIQGLGVLAEIAQGRALCSVDVREDPSFLGFPPWHPPVKAMIGLPIKEQSKTIAILVVGRGLEGEPFSDEDHSLLETLASLVAVANQTAKQMEELGRLNAKLEVLAHTDQMTGVGNRRGFEEEVQRFESGSLRYGWPFGLLMIDVDSFKAYNDHYGHQAGDQVLIRIAKLLAASIRADDRIFRYGGEEFVLLLPHQLEDGTLAAAERLRKIVEGLAILHEGIPRGIVTISLGAACYLPQIERARGGRWHECLQRADRALYQAKAAGRNRTIAAAEPGARPLGHSAKLIT